MTKFTREIERRQREAEVGVEDVPFPSGTAPLTLPTRPSSPQQVASALSSGDGGFRAHALRELQVSRGNAYATRLASDTRAVQRQPLPAQSFDYDPDLWQKFRSWNGSPESDTNEVSWQALIDPFMPMLSELTPVKGLSSLASQPAPRKPQDVRDPQLQHSSSIQYCPPHHKQSDALQQRRLQEMMDEFEQSEREEIWRAFASDALHVEQGWNQLVPLAVRFGKAQDDPTLQQADVGLKKLSESKDIDLSQLAERERVPLKGNDGATLGSLFKKIGEIRDIHAVGEAPDPKQEPIILRGTDLDMSKADERGIAHAGRSTTVEHHVKETQVVEAELAAGLSNVKAKMEGVSRAGQDVVTAEAEMRQRQGEKAQAEAEAGLQKVVSERDSLKGTVATLLSVVTGVLELGVGFPAAGALAGAGGDATKAGVGTFRGMVAGNVEPISAGSGLIGIIAGKIIDSAYAEEIAAAQAKVDAAVAAVTAAKDEVVASKLLAAQKALKQAEGELQTAIKQLSPVYIRRRDVYDTLAGSAAAASGGSSKTRGDIAGFIAAIPIAEIVVARCSELAAAVERAIPSYSKQSGKGFRMADVAGRPTKDFLNTVSALHGMRDLVGGTYEFWGDRVKALQAVVEKLGGLGG
jgi:hypothetical protein